MERAAVLGPSGLLGKATLDALINENIPTTILVRDLSKFKKLYPDEKYPGRINAIQGDMDNHQALASVLDGADTIFPCFNPEYSKWPMLFPNWISKVADAGAALQARIVFPGNLMNYQYTETDIIDEEHSQNAQSEKGQLRIALEQRLLRSSLEGATVTILRYPHVYGPAGFDQIISPIFRSALENQKCSWPGNPDLFFNFIHSTDVGKTMVQAALMDEFADNIVHVPGLNPLSARDWIGKVYTAAGSSISDKIHVTPSWRDALIGFFKRETNELRELRYMYENPLILSDSKFKTILGEFKFNDHEIGLKQTLNWFRYWLSK